MKDSVHRQNQELSLVRKVLIDKAFPFAKKIAPVYELLHWTWREEGVPDAEIIADMLVDLIERCAPNSTIATGGLSVHISTEDKIARIAFEMEEEFDWGDE